MMIYPPIAKLVEKTGSRYTLVLETAKRARQISGGAQALTDVKSNKEVTLATNEIYEDKLHVFPIEAANTDAKDEASAQEVSEEIEEA